MHYLLMGEMRLAFIDSDLLHRGDCIHIQTYNWERANWYMNVIFGE